MTLVSRIERLPPPSFQRWLADLAVELIDVREEPSCSQLIGKLDRASSETAGR